jgi:hypothetical protein
LFLHTTQDVLSVLCPAGLLWHVLTNPIYITQDLFTRYQEATGNYNCPESGAAANGTAVAAADGPENNVALEKKKGNAGGGGDDGFEAPPADASECSG